MSKIITICGSSRFIEQMAVIGWILEKDENAIVMSLHLLPWWYCAEDIPDHIAEHEGVADNMDALHLKKIDLSDEIFVVDWDCYIGSSTRNEIAHAIKENKNVRYLTCETGLYKKIRQLLSDGIKIAEARLREGNDERVTHD